MPGRKADDQRQMRAGDGVRAGARGRWQDIKVGSRECSESVKLGENNKGDQVVGLGRRFERYPMTGMPRGPTTRNVMRVGGWMGRCGDIRRCKCRDAMLLLFIDKQDGKMKEKME